MNKNQFRYHQRLKTHRSLGTARYPGSRKRKCMNLERDPNDYEYKLSELSEKFQRRSLNFFPFECLPYDLRAEIYEWTLVGHDEISIKQNQENPFGRQPFMSPSTLVATSKQINVEYNHILKLHAFKPSTKICVDVYHFWVHPLFEFLKARNLFAHGPTYKIFQKLREPKFLIRFDEDMKFTGEEVKLRRLFDVIILTESLLNDLEVKAVWSARGCFPTRRPYDIGRVPYSGSTVEDIAGHVDGSHLHWVKTLYADVLYTQMRALHRSRGPTEYFQAVNMATRPDILYWAHNQRDNLGNPLSARPPMPRPRHIFKTLLYYAWAFPVRH